MERLWLIRTRHNKILGPVALKKIAELLGKGSLGPYDEICSGNGYWIRIREEALVQKYIHLGQEQAFNPLNSAKLHANLFNFIDEVISGKRPIRENTSAQIQTNTDISMIGKNLPKIDPATINNAATPTSAAGVGTMPSADDLAYPSMDDIAQIDASVDPAKVATAAAAPKSNQTATPSPAGEGGGGKLPSADDLDFPDMGGGSTADASPAGEEDISSAGVEESALPDENSDEANDSDEDAGDEDPENQRSFADLPVAPGTTSKSTESQTGILTRAHFDLRKLQKAQAEEAQAEIEASGMAGSAENANTPQFTSLPDMEDYDEEEEEVQKEFEKSSVIRVKSLGKKQRAQNLRNRIGLVIVIAIIVGILFAIGPIMQQVAQYKKNLKPAAEVTATTEETSEGVEEAVPANSPPAATVAPSPTAAATPPQSEGPSNEGAEEEKADEAADADAA